MPATINGHYYASLFNAHDKASYSVIPMTVPTSVDPIPKPEVVAVNDPDRGHISILVNGVERARVYDAASAVIVAIAMRENWR